jgi:hypothetical protein
VYESVTSHRRDERRRLRRLRIHVYGVTVATLEDVSRAARTVDYRVILIDDSAHTVLVDQCGRIVIRSEDAPVCTN